MQEGPYTFTHSSGVYGQRYAADGSKVDGEFHINTFTERGQSNPSVASFVDGGFVVAWNGAGTGDLSGIHAKIFAHPEQSQFGSAGNDVLSGNAADNAIFGGLGNDSITGGLGNDFLDGGDGNDTIHGGAGNDYVEGDSGIGDDLLFGDDGHDIIVGNAGNDTLDGGAGYDRLDGGDGNDVISGGTDGDTFIFTLEANAADIITDFDVTNANEKIDLTDASFTNLNLLSDLNITADGTDVIVNLGSGHTIRLNGVNVADLTVDHFLGIYPVGEVITGTTGDDFLQGTAGSDTIIGLGGNDYIFGGTGNDTFVFVHKPDVFAYDDIADFTSKETIDLSDSSFSHIQSFADLQIMFWGWGSEIDLGSGHILFVESMEQYELTADNFIFFTGSTNTDPILATPITDVATNEDAAFILDISSNFSDENVDDTLTYTATLADGTALPTWMSFDTATGIFSGTPDNNDVFTISVTVTADDNNGGTPATDTFDIEVINTNDAPVVTTPIADQSTLEDATYAFTVPANTFGDDDIIHGDVLTLSATLADGSSLPTWIAFDNVTGSFSGTPLNIDAGILNVKVTATDIAGIATNELFALEVINTNDAPVVATPIADQSTLEDAVYAFTVPANTFGDDDLIHGDVLTISATLVDGSALPTWISFDNVTSTFSGTPLNGDVGILNVKVTATDIAGTSTNELFAIEVVNTNDAPVVITPIADQSTLEDATYAFTVPANTFGDDDLIHGDVLTLSATLVDGSALPTWISFDNVTGTFSGTPLNSDVGILNVKVTATDIAGTSTDELFALEVINTNDAPVVATPIADQSTLEDAAYAFTVPANTFADDDIIHGDVLTLSATLADGSALPTWISFDAGTGTFSGTPLNSNVGILNVKVTATDIAGTSTNELFALEVINTNDAPIVATPIAGQSTLEDATYAFTVPANTFGDDDIIHGDVLTLSATLADGSALPTWMAFDSVTGTFNGTPLNSNVGILNVKVTATDIAGTSTNELFALEVINTNDAPVVATQIVDIAVVEDTAFSLDIFNNFADVDVGDILTYSATLADGSALPSGLLFDGITGTFSGTPTEEDNDDKEDDDDAESNEGILNVKVTATDIAGTSATSSFHIDIMDEDTILLTGTSGNDILSADDEDTVIYGFAGNDIITGDKGEDTLRGHDGNDTLDGGKDKDLLSGGNGDDILRGGKDKDVLFGDAGNDELYGDKGKDTLDGGAGSDVLTGGKGHDIFVFSDIAASTTTSIDIITDFDDDMIDVSTLGFTDIADGTATGSILGYTNDGVNTFISAANSTFTIQLNGIHELDADDFVF